MAVLVHLKHSDPKKFPAELVNNSKGIGRQKGSKLGSQALTYRGSETRMIRMIIYEKSARAAYLPHTKTKIKARNGQSHK